MYKKIPKLIMQWCGGDRGGGYYDQKLKLFTSKPISQAIPPSPLLHHCQRQWVVQGRPYSLPSIRDNAKKLNENKCDIKLNRLNIPA